MLLPFVFVQFPLGRLADKKWGEKEILSLGFIIVAIATGLISFISGGSMILWMTILFITRIGAATIEIMCDTYFFKKVDCWVTFYLLNSCMLCFLKVGFGKSTSHLSNLQTSRIPKTISFCVGFTSESGTS
jgi:MFS family permease